MEDPANATNASCVNLDIFTLYTSLGCTEQLGSLGFQGGQPGIVPQFWAGCSSVYDSLGINYLGQPDQGSLSASGGGMLWPISWSWSSVACREDHDWSMLREAERLAQPGCSRKEAGLTRTVGWSGTLSATTPPSPPTDYTDEYPTHTPKFLAALQIVASLQLH